MAVAAEIDLNKYCADVAARAKRASARLAVTSGSVKNKWLRRSAELLREHCEQIEEANERDLAAAPGYGLTDAASRPLAADTATRGRNRGGPGTDRGFAGPDRRSHSLDDPPQRPADRQSARAAGRDIFHLRVAAERDGRRGGDLR